MYIDIYSRKYKVIGKLGKGGFGSVYKVMNENQFYAIKEINIEDESKESITEVLKEAEFLSKFDNEYIIKYFGSSINNDKFYIIMEYVDGKDLRNILNEYIKENKKIDEKIIINIIKQICLGIREIHNKNIIHRDLKPENILLDKNNKIKIGDFGISKQFNSYKSYTFTLSGKSTIVYAAPEIYGNGNYNKKSDIYSLGCIIYELFTLSLYFNDKMRNNIKTINNDKYQKLINSSLEVDCNKRLDIEQILNNFILDKNLEKDRNRAFNTDNYFGMNNYISFKQSEGYGYINSGLQIIASCNILVKELININYEKSLFIRALIDAIKKLNNDNIFDATSFSNFIMKNIPGFIENVENDSQKFIKAFIYKINDELINLGHLSKEIPFYQVFNDKKTKEKYLNFIHKLNVQSKIFSIFSYISQRVVRGYCDCCKRNLDYEDFSSDILLNINLEKSHYNAHLSGEDLIDLFRQSNIDLSCPYCKRKNQLKSKQDLIKLPEILIINIQNNIYKKIPINLKVDEIIEIKSYMSSELYELFAINRNIGNNKHYICQVKKNGKWYEINDDCCFHINKQRQSSDGVCGLFYKKKSCDW